MTNATDLLQDLAHLAALPCRQLRVYSTRPATVHEHFAALGREVESLSLTQALLHGQLARRRKAQAKTQSEPHSV